ncbi:MAG TPA: S-layer homology domain-containing protein [Candidatus Peribacteraceae bacterium]|nr:S-layer homology domain-containing protein [Candidatus Peribacteraceae bacterium]
MSRPIVFLLSTLVGVSYGSLSMPAFAEGGTITITQTTPLENYFGTWSLLNPDGEELKNARQKHVIQSAMPGDYLFLIDPPSGMTTVVTASRNGEIISTESIPRTRIAVADGDTWEIGIVYEFGTTGEVSVSTSPPGVDFTLQGPDGLKLKGTTPASFNPVPVGPYSVSFSPIEGCPKISPKSDQLQRHGRISLAVVLECTPAAMARLSPGSGQTLKYVSMTSGNQTIVFTDVPISEWFAPFVHIVARVGIMSGYQNASGQPAGRFGPNDPVNLAQLSKIAHEVAGIDEKSVRGTARNPRAVGAWFESYFLSAEKLSWQIFLDPSEDPARLVTRGEVIATLLQALDVPRIWPKGDVFSDVTPLTPYADSIETAAADDIVGGNDDGTFKAADPINRAELSKILAQILEVYGDDTPEMTGQDPRDAPRSSASQ